MNRAAIREYARALIYEYTEKPLGSFKDDQSGELDMNEMINVSVQNVQLDLCWDIPWYFYKPVLISLDANVREYHVEDDLCIDDFLLFWNLFHNEPGKPGKGLTYADSDQIPILGINVGEKGDPKCWGYESKDIIRFDPTPSTARTDWYKGFYFYELPDLNQDTDHTPSEDKYAIPALPKPAHILVAIDVAEQCVSITGETKVFDKLYEKNRARALKLVGLKPSLSLRWRPGLKDLVRGF